MVNSCIKQQFFCKTIEEDVVSKTISMLPRHPDDSKIVAVQLKRKLEMKNSQLEEYIRPAKCIRAVKKLKELGNPFYQDVTIVENFMELSEGFLNESSFFPKGFGS